MKPVCIEIEQFQQLEKENEDLKRDCRNSTVRPYSPYAELIKELNTPVKTFEEFEKVFTVLKENYKLRREELFQMSKELTAVNVLAKSIYAQNVLETFPHSTLR